MNSAAVAVAAEERRHVGLQRVIALASGLLTAFAAFGFASWVSGAISWVAFYLGARGAVLTGLAQAAVFAGFALGLCLAVTWHLWRRRRGATDIPPAAALAACVILPLGNIFWATFVDAIAYHYGQDLVRPAFDLAVMWLVLGAVPVLTFTVPWILTRLARKGVPRA